VDARPGTSPRSSGVIGARRAGAGPAARASSSAKVGAAAPAAAPAAAKGPA
jgi:hypothetical protein